MFRFNATGVSCALGLALSACGPATVDDPMMPNNKPSMTTPVNFKVRFENVAPFHQLKSGRFAIPVGKANPGPLAPGDAFEFSFTAARGNRLAFAMMLGASNDWVLATEGKGVDLFENGVALSGDITSKIGLYDVGSEIDEEPGVGQHTGPNQANSPDGPGAADPNNTVRKLGNRVRLTSGADFTLPAVSAMAKVTVTPRGSTFTVRIENVSSDTVTLVTSQGVKPTRFSPGVWALSNGDDALFTEGQPDRGQGLEAIAEMGAIDQLAASLVPLTGAATTMSPGVLVVHSSRAPLFTLGERDRGMGLERIAEDGQADPLSQRLKSMPEAGISKVAVFDTPTGRENPSAVMPGRAFELEVTAVPGDKISFASMFSWSNDWFFGTDEQGIALFTDDGQPLYGPITGEVKLFDLGTELSEEVFVGPNTGPQQAEPNTGFTDTNDHVREVTSAEYPLPVSHHLKVTLSAADGQPSL